MKGQRVSLDSELTLQKSIILQRRHLKLIKGIKLKGLKYICLEKPKLIFFPSPEIWRSSQPYNEYSLAFIGTLTILGAVNRMYKTLFHSVSVILGSFF